MSVKTEMYMDMKRIKKNQDNLEFQEQSWKTFCSIQVSNNKSEKGQENKNNAYL